MIYIYPFWGKKVYDEGSPDPALILKFKKKKSGSFPMKNLGDNISLHYG